MSDDADLLMEGVALFNAGRFFEAHEVWEDLWRATPGEPRLFQQGLIHAAVGLHHAQRGNAVGARSQIGKALLKLRRFPASYAGLDNGAVIRRLDGILRRLLAGGAVTEGFKIGPE
jgi:predicted metal-dependent hydrolase